MSNLREIKKRVKSVKNIGKITKALEMVSASKVGKAQDEAVSARPYSEKIFEVVNMLSGNAKEDVSPLLRQPTEVGSRLYILITTNRGLVGSLNTNLFRHLNSEIKKENNIKFVNIGKKGRNFALSNGELVADFSDYKVGDAVTSTIALVTELFEKEEVDEVYIVYSDFVSALKQEPTVKKLLPLTKVEEEEVTNDVNYTFEPSPDEVLNALLPLYLEVQLTESFLEAQASEHSARMVAMKSASDNASSVSSILDLAYNKTRQQAITTEINDIVTASLSIAK